MIRVFIKHLILLALVGTAWSVLAASSMRVHVQGRDVYIRESGKSTVMHVVFSDEPLVLNVTATAFTNDELRSTLLLADDSSWWTELTFTVKPSTENEFVKLGKPSVLRSVRRERGPDADLPRNRDTMTPATTLEADLSFEVIEPGDYEVRVEGLGLQNSMRFFVRTGGEPEVRDEFLNRNALRARTYDEYRSIQLERYENDPERKGLVALGELMDRALIDGTLEEADRYFSMALASLGARSAKATDPKAIAEFDRSIRMMSKVRESLPEYFDHRPEWRMVSNPGAGTYSIIGRDGRVVRTFGRGAETDQR